VPDWGLVIERLEPTRLREDSLKVFFFFFLFFFFLFFFFFFFVLFCVNACFFFFWFFFFFFFFAVRLPGRSRRRKQVTRVEARAPECRVPRPTPRGRRDAGDELLEDACGVRADLQVRPLSLGFAFSLQSRAANGRPLRALQIFFFFFFLATVFFLLERPSTRVDFFFFPVFFIFQFSLRHPCAWHNEHGRRSRFVYFARPWFYDFFSVRAVIGVFLRTVPRNQLFFRRARSSWCSHRSSAVTLDDSPTPHRQEAGV